MSLPSETRALLLEALVVLMAASEHVVSVAQSGWSEESVRARSDLRDMEETASKIRAALGLSRFPAKNQTHCVRVVEEDGAVCIVAIKKDSDLPPAPRWTADSGPEDF